MSDNLEAAFEELKRVDHIIYVSLKYTRTVDIILNALERVKMAFDFGILALLEHLKENGKIESIPPQPIKRIKKVMEAYEDNERIVWLMNFYQFLRKVITAPFDRREEYRRHVTHIAHLDKLTVENNIDTLEDNVDKYLREFLKFVRIELGFVKEE